MTRTLYHQYGKYKPGKIAVENSRLFAYGLGYRVDAEAK